jgi:hypothetical protein
LWSTILIITIRIKINHFHFVTLISCVTSYSTIVHTFSETFTVLTTHWIILNRSLTSSSLNFFTLQNRESLPSSRSNYFSHRGIRVLTSNLSKSYWTSQLLESPSQSFLLDSPSQSQLLHLTPPFNVTFYSLIFFLSYLWCVSFNFQLQRLHFRC